MKIHRFIGEFQLKSGPYTITDEEIIHQIWDVLKLRSGEKIVLCDGMMNEATATIDERTDAGIAVTIDEIKENQNTVRRAVRLYCAILKSDHFELVCQKATEVGVSEIVPMITDRTVKTNIRPERLEKIIREAAELSDRGTVPMLLEAVTFEEALEQTKDHEQKILLHRSGGPLNDTELATEPVDLFVGPEGGWTDEELTLATDFELTIMSLGRLMMRAETAAIVATYLATR